VKRPVLWSLLKRFKWQLLLSCFLAIIVEALHIASPYFVRRIILLAAAPTTPVKPATQSLYEAYYWIAALVRCLFGYFL